MKKISVFTLIFALISCFSAVLTAQTERKAIGNLLVEGIPNLPAELIERLDQYQNIRAAGFADWDASGNGIYISTRFGDVAQIHHVAKPGAFREQLTFFKEPIGGVSSCPNPSRDGFLFSKDVGGNENFQIHFFDRKKGTISMLTDGKSRNGNARWNKKGDKIAFSSTLRTGKDVDFYMKASLEAPPQLILENKGGGWAMVDWSDDDRLMLVRNGISINESKIFVFDIANKRLEPINPNDQAIAYSAMRFSKDGKGVYLLSDENSEFAVLRYYDLATRKMTKLVELNWEIEGFDLSDDGTNLAFTVNENGYSKVYLMDTKTTKYRPLSNLPKGFIGGLDFSADNQRLAMTITTATTVADVYVMNLKTDKPERWTMSEIGGLNAANFTDCRLIEFPTFDNDEKTGKPRQIPAFLYTPKNATAKTPVVIDIHGGPEGQSLPTFSNWRQFLVNELGIAVLVPNVRGSTGYGKNYLKLDNGMLRENSVKDIGALLDWVAKQPNLDAQRVAVFGGSYGGYMSLACMTFYNNRLKCGVDLFGISNFNTFLKNTSGYRVDLRRVEYGDERDPKMAEHLQKISPLTNIKNITKPMFIFQGENDPRVPLTESEQMLEALKQNGVKTWYVRAKDEGHGIAKKANRDYTNAAMAAFLKTFLME